MEREDYVYRAKLAEQAERYEEMVSAITEVSKKDGELSVEERNLLSVAYKNVIGARRTSWRIIKSVEEKDTKSSDGASAALDKQYREQIEEELTALCTEIITLLDDTLVPKAKDAESKVFFYKMKGDYYRYQSEFMTGDKRDDASAKSKQAYEDAYEAASGLATTHPIRLGLALNFSVFHYEIMNNPKEACKLAKGAFDNAISELDSLSEDSYKDSTLIMQLLRDNLTLWTSDQDPGSSEVQDIEDGEN